MSIITLLLLSAALGALVVYGYNRWQRSDALRRNFPLFANIVRGLETLSAAVRHYILTPDDEGLPFKRDDRKWAYRAAQNDIKQDITAFGSTRKLKPGSVVFANTPFPQLQNDLDHTASNLIIGEHCHYPYAAESVFNMSAMSFGAISGQAVLALSQGAYKARCWMNTGEGGLSPYHLQGGADLVFQIGTAKYGVRDEHGQLDINLLTHVATHPTVRMFELKLSQGASPGRGGFLPGIKVTPEIATLRGIPAYEDSVSPDRHHDISNADELLDVVNRIRDITGKPVGFKFVMGDPSWLDTLFVKIHERGLHQAPDFITLDGSEGGAAAAPASLTDFVGLSLGESLPILVDKLRQYNLKSRIRVIASGKMVTPSEVAWALCMGADFVNGARGFLFALGCIQAMQCHKNTCPTGITTHNAKLTKGLVPSEKSNRVDRYVRNMIHEVGEISHACGVEEPRRLRRRHGRVMTTEGKTVSLADLYPETIS